MLHLTGIKYLVNNTNENVKPLDGDNNSVMAKLHEEMAYMYAADTLKGLTILIVDDDMNTVKRTQEFKAVGEADEVSTQLTGIQYVIDGEDIVIPAGGYNSLNAAMGRYHTEMKAMYDANALRGCGIKIYKNTLEDVLNETEFKA